MTDPDRPHTTPEGHEPEAPAPSELGKLGTPGAGMTPAIPHPADAEEREGTGDAVAHHDAATHMDAHTAVSDDDHGHVEPRVGPIDWAAWAYAALGALAGLVVAGLFYVATI
ncbi:MAG TPA: hypothetical protein VK992_05310 [Candidatus Caenarcaniphilales bacterium]|nr:hypothetical protein [Candidatus Caenarcaniphilales bacterium]